MDSTRAMAHTVNPANERGREGFYQRAGGQNLAPLWRVLGALVTDEPVSPVKATIWKYNEVRPYLMEACKLITAAEAERRVMMLENPGLPGQSRITHSLFAGLQIILPGEIAPAHRHVASALRFIIEGKDAYTAVAGEKTSMLPGDFVITPSMTWHDHGNEGNGPMVWLDGLDVPIVNLMDASFRDGYPEASHPLTRPEGAAEIEYGYNMLPLDQEFGGQTSPIFNYPYARTRDGLEKLRRFRKPDPYAGFKMKFINPVTGGWAMPTISTWMQLVPKGFKTQPYRSTDSTVFTVVEGSGTSTIGGQRFDWQAHDIFVAPSWHFQEHVASEDAVLFGFSDRVCQEKLGFFREQRGNEAR
ncbi:MAG TPA: gentisate 1,2-dioxygenase [Stellaceae bacterium]|nr:gentisate 1,2-dioxygenase [Stellaceae bacterium]